MNQSTGSFAFLLLALIGITQATPLNEQNAFSFGWPGSLIDNSDYYVSDKEASWFAANYYCYSKGWELVAPDDFETITLLKGFRELYGVIGKTYWSAGNRLATGNWVWGLNGQQFSYSDWGTGQPNGNYSDNCLLLEQTADALWSNANCAAKYRFICQKTKEIEATKKCGVTIF